MQTTLPNFDYFRAFDRNSGWITRQEQEKLRASCVAIIGVGGAGGYAAQSLARLGVGHFKITDPDVYEFTNFNRQVGASMNTLGRSKSEVMKEMLLSINPEIKVDAFNERFTQNNIGQFLDGVDLVIDGIDYFEIDAKALLFQKSRERGLTIITSCPLGFGATLLTFTPQGMSFDKYFDLKPEMSLKEKILSLTLGLSPYFFCLEYMERSRGVSLKDRRGASVCSGLMLVGALASTESVKVLTGKGRVFAVPHVFQIDMLLQKVSRSYYPWGMGGPLGRIKRSILGKFMKID